MIGTRLKRTLWLAARSLWLHRLRSGLTVLGIVFGVCSVIAMLAIGEGASYEAQEQIRQLGSTNIIVRSVKPPEKPGSTSTAVIVSEYGLTYTDAERIRETIPSVEVLVPARRIRKTISHGGRRMDAVILGTVPWFPQVTGRRVARGRFLVSADLHRMRNVCVLEPGVAEELFPFGGALGQAVKIGTDYYRVVGIAEPSSRPGSSGEHARAAAGGVGAYIPLTAARSRFGEILVNVSSGSREMERVELHEITVRVGDLKDVIPTAGMVRALLERFHSRKDYEMIVPLELLNRARRIKRTYDIVLGSIAAISLLVGGIGIMNIMLATVTERTREIGIRRALGAKRRDIVLQFLTETVLLAAWGGVLGVALGLVVPSLVERFAGMKTIVTWWSLAAAVVISGAVGIVFGLYPAWRAAQMDPVEALRHE